MTARVLMIDNYDSFTYNLVQALRALGARVDVYRNDAIDVARARSLAPSHLVVSPGPGRPEAAGVTLEMIDAFTGRIPVLGVCLGMQALAAVRGGKVVEAQRPVHGKATVVHHDGKTVFRDLPQPLRAGRYHSLVVDPDRLPPELTVSAHDEEGEIMGIRHEIWPVEGVQFHPESILTPEGNRLLANFLALAPRRI